MDLGFLKDIKLDAISKGSPAKTAVVKLPTDAHLRVFANGKVFPSKAFAESCGLEFVPKQVIVEGSEPEIIGNGLDIFSSDKWGMISSQMPEGVVVLFGCVVPKSFPKVDMWGSTKYDAETGAPKASVFTQGQSVFSRTLLLDMVVAAFGIDWTVTEYVDMSFDTAQPIASPNKMYDLPKVVSGGKAKGTWTTVRRQNVEIFPLVMVDAKNNGIPAGPVETKELESPMGDPEMTGEAIATETGESLAEMEVSDPVTFSDEPSDPNPEVAAAPAPVQPEVVRAQDSEPVRQMPAATQPLPTAPAPVPAAVPVQPTVPPVAPVPPAQGNAGLDWAARLQQPLKK